MPLPTPEPGLVICYAYLWRSDFEQGKEEGVKDRPCAIILTAHDEDDDTIVTVVPVTHTPPKHSETAVEIPAATKARLGLDPERSWIIVSEINRFIWPGPDLRPISRSKPDRFEYGLLPPSLFRLIKEKLTACAKAQRLKAVSRT